MTSGLLVNPYRIKNLIKLKKTHWLQWVFGKIQIVSSVKIIRQTVSYFFSYFILLSSLFNENTLLIFPMVSAYGLLYLSHYYIAGIDA